MSDSPAEHDDSGQRNGPQSIDVAVEQQDATPSIPIRAVYFLFIGWWASGIWLSIAWFLTLTVVGIPLGIKMVNKVPKVVSLKDQQIEMEITQNEDGSITVSESTKEQYSLVVRGVYFLLVGWWVSGIWMSIAWLATISILGLPVAVWMYNRLPFVVSLYRY